MKCNESLTNVLREARVTFFRVQSRNANSIPAENWRGSALLLLHGSLCSIPWPHCVRLRSDSMLHRFGNIQKMNRFWSETNKEAHNLFCCAAKQFGWPETFPEQTWRKKFSTRTSVESLRTTQLWRHCRILSVACQLVSLRLQLSTHKAFIWEIFGWKNFKPFHLWCTLS